MSAFARLDFAEHCVGSVGGHDRSENHHTIIDPMGSCGLHLHDQRGKIDETAQFAGNRVFQAATMKWRFSLALLLLVVTACCIVCAVWRATRPDSPYDGSAVLRDCDFKNAKLLKVLRWRRMVDERPLVVDSIVVLAKTDNKYLLLEAYRHPDTYSTWSISETSVLYDDWEDWIIGEREFDRPPTENELKAFLDYVGWDDTHGFRVVFQGQESLP